jgi:SNF2 family DNA or RNA helicase
MDTAECSDVRTSWRLVTDDSTFLEQGLGNYKLSSTGATQQPLDLAPMAEGVTLRAEQIKTVSWAVMQENDPQPFVEEEVVESRIAKLKYRLMGKAERTVLRRGGILASEVGYGKTAVVLALTQHQKAADIARVKQEEQLAETSNQPGLIPIKATLILMPAHLIDQWVTEVEKFLPIFTNVLAVKQYDNLKGKTIAEMQQFDIIVMSWRACCLPAYVNALSQVAGTVDIANSAPSPRALAAWYEAALKKVEQNVLLLRKDSKNLDTALHQQIDDQLASVQDTQRLLPSRRLVGDNFQKAKKKGKLQVPAKPTKSTIEPIKKILHFGKLYGKKEVPPPHHWLRMNHVVLEMFKFSRIVVDEYHYADTAVRRIIMGLTARSKWLLSGTPSVDTFANVKSMAELVGVKLGTHDYVSMPADVFKKAIADMTATEKFLVYEPPPSPMWVKRRDDVAQLFLSRFLRQDQALYRDIETEKTIVLVRQSAAERAAYIDVEYQLAMNDFKIPLKTQSDSDYDVQLRLCFDKHKEAEEALLWRAAYFSPDLANEDDALYDADDGVDSRPSLCDTILAARKKKYDFLYQQLRGLLHRAEVLQRCFIEAIEVGGGTNNCYQYIEFKRRMNDKSAADVVIDEKNYQMSHLVKEAARESENMKPADFRIPEKAENYKSLEDLLAVGRVKSRGKLMLAAEYQLRAVVEELQFVLSELIKHIRLMRLANAVCSFQKQKTLSKCNRCEGPGNKASIIWQCGHVLCDKCQGEGVCKVSGCGAIITGFAPVGDTEFDLRDAPQLSKYGSKIAKLLELVQDIQSKEERVLLFIQDPHAIALVEKIFQSKNITVERLDTGDASKKLVGFNETTLITALILNVGDESAAGCNLTAANNVIFFTPYMTRGSAAITTYKAAMKQAIGRAKRFGQKKKVYIYHLLVSETFDVDLYEDRNDSILLDRSDFSIEDVQREDLPEADRHTKYGSHLYGTILGRVEELEDADNIVQ